MNSSVIPAPEKNGKYLVGRFREPVFIPNDYAQLIKRFQTEEACLSYLIRIRWPGSLPKHPATQEHFISIRTDKKLIIYPNGKQISALRETPMLHSKIPMTRWFWASHLLSHYIYRVPKHNFRRLVGVRTATAKNMRIKLKEAFRFDIIPMAKGLVEVGWISICKPTCPMSVIQILGYSQIDHANAKKTNDGLTTNIYMKAIDEVSNESVRNFFHSHVAAGSQIVFTNELENLFTISSWGYKTVSKVDRHNLTFLNCLKLKDFFAELRIFLDSDLESFKHDNMQRLIDEYIISRNFSGNETHLFHKLLGIK